MNYLDLRTKNRTRDGRPEVVLLPFHAIREVRYVLGGENVDECYINGELFQISVNDVREAIVQEGEKC